jgi:hypothetical protein
MRVPIDPCTGAVLAMPAAAPIAGQVMGGQVMGGAPSLTPMTGAAPAGEPTPAAPSGGEAADQAPSLQRVERPTGEPAGETGASDQQEGGAKDPPPPPGVGDAADFAPELDADGMQTLPESLLNGPAAPAATRRGARGQSSADSVLKRLPPINDPDLKAPPKNSAKGITQPRGAGRQAGADVAT